MKQNVKQEDKQQATPLMKTVARRAPNQKHMARVFSPQEIKEINDSVDAGKEENPETAKEQSRKYHRIKHLVKEMEDGNKSRVIVFPAVKGDGGWYKVMNFSALYYVYKLAERMGRSGAMRPDNERHSKALYIASLRDIEKFAKQFEELEHPTLEITEDGIYIFTLKEPLTDDEVGMLRNIEETRRERTHNVLRPKAMDPAAYQAILMLARQMLPRIRKLEKNYYLAVGEKMASDMTDLLAAYFCYADGALDKKTTGVKLIALVDRLMAGVALLSETQVWSFDVATAIGENTNNLKRIIVKDFKIGEK